MVRSTGELGWIVLKKRIPITFDMRETIHFSVKIVIACLFMGLAIRTSTWTFSAFFGTTLIGKTAYVLYLGLMGSITYVLLCHLLKIKENKEVFLLCREKIIYLAQRIKTRHVSFKGNNV